MNDKYDNVLIGVLQNEGEIAGFLDAILGFLYRRTDYYRIMKSKTDKMGFPPGTALNLLVGAFKKYEKIATEDEKQRERIKVQDARKREKEKEKVMKEQLKSVSDTVPPPVAQQVEVTSILQTSTGTHESEMAPDTSQPHKKPNNIPDTANNSQTTTSHVESSDLSSSERRSREPGASGDDEDPELTRQQAIFQANSESYNGAIRDKYSWSQSIQDLDVHVKIPKYIRKGKDIQVVIEKKHIKVSHKDETGSTVELMEGDLCWEINKDESMWNLVPGEHILINLDKKQERWWEAVLTSEPKINVRKIDASRPMTDLDDEAQAKIEEMMFNERQKKMGLPQTHEKKVHDVLSQAWNAEGSPFKGQTFDPSKINVGQGGMVTINDNDDMEQK